MSARTFTVLIAIGFIAALGWWIQEAVTPIRDAVPRKPSDAPDYFIEQFVASATNDRGQLRYKLSARYLNHYDQRRPATLEQPRFVFQQPPGSAITLRAEHGTWSENQNILRLPGAVIIGRAASEYNRPVHITTRDVEVHPERRYAETDKAVRIRSGNAVLEGVGMRVFIDEGRLQLLSNARGTYVPETP